MAKSIEIVSHCYAVEHPHYAACLCYQLSSLARTNARATVCWCSEDELTAKVIHFFEGKGTIDLKSIVLTRGELSRRAIGRNQAALSSDADIVWFADCDEVFRDGILDRLSAMFWPWHEVMFYPREIMIHKDHVTGDKATRKVKIPDVVQIDPSEFIPKKYTKAIGGVQIVRGDFVRRFGYLKDDKKGQKPNEVVLGDFRDDIAYRKFCASSRSVDLPGLYRIRHSTTSYQ